MTLMAAQNKIPAEYISLGYFSWAVGLILSLCILVYLGKKP